MFHAGAVVPSSVFLLQLLTGPVGDIGPPSVALDEFEPPVNAGLRALLPDITELFAVALLVPLPLAPLLNPPYPPLEVPVCVGLIVLARFGPIVVEKRLELIELATRLNAPKH